MICINCGYEHHEKFCPNCGENSKVAKITFSSIANDAFSTIANMDRGFLYNIKTLLIKPAKIVNDYIHGKRKGIFNPISFLIVSITIYLIGISLLEVSHEKHEIKSSAYSFGYEAGRFIQGYLKYFWILSIIWLSVSTKLLFKKYNYAEHLAVNSFVIGQATLVGLVGYLLLKLPLLFNPIIYLIITWMTYKIYKKKNSIDLNTFFLALGSTFLFSLQLFLIVVLVGIVRS